MKTLRKTLPLHIIFIAISVILGCKKSNTKPENVQPITATDAEPVVTGVMSGASGPPNSTFTITGRNFSKDFKESKIVFGDVTVPASAGNDTYIQANVPDSAVPGGLGITVITNGKTIKPVGIGFLVEAPTPKLVDWLRVSGAMRGSKMAIYGYTFSTNKARTKVTINGVPAIIDSVNVGAIYITIPANATSGEVVVTTYDNIAMSYDKNFKILPSTVTSVGTGTYRFKNISIDASGNVYGIDNNKVMKVTPGGVTTTLATIGNINTFILGSTAVDATGNVYVSSGNSYTATGKFEPTENSFKIFKITPVGNVSILAGSTQGFANAQGINAKFLSPTSLTIDPSTGNLYVNDAKVIRKITPAGEVSTFAGHNESSGHADVLVGGLIQFDGQGVAAKFVEITAMAFDAKTKTLYITDSGARTFRKAASDGTVTSIHLTPESGLNGNNIITSSTLLTNMTVDANGTVYIGAGRNVYKVKDGVSTNTYLNPVSGYDVNGLTMDSAGNVYVSNYSSFPNFPAVFSIYKIVL